MPDPRYRQWVFETSTANCRGGMDQGKVTADGVDMEDKQTFTVVVWPDVEPTHEGELIALDDADLSESFRFKAKETFTVRTSEKIHTTGFKWEAPADTTVWNCVTLDNNNFGDFVTGYSQWVFTSLDKDADCEEEVTLTRKDGSGVDKMTIKVDRGHCPVIECPDDQILDLDPYSCECKALNAGFGVVFDSRTTTTPLVRIDKFEQFTIREWATTNDDGTTGPFAYSALDVSTLECVSEVAKFEDQWARYRQVSFEASKDDCRGDLIQDKVDAVAGDTSG
jgi:hypothetical protein